MADWPEQWVLDGHHRAVRVEWSLPIQVPPPKCIHPEFAWLLTSFHLICRTCGYECSVADYHVRQGYDFLKVGDHYLARRKSA